METAIKRRVLLGLNAALAVVLLAVIGYKLSLSLFPSADVRIAPEPDCSVHHRPCSATLPEGRVALELMTRPIPLARAFQVSLDTHGIAPRKVEIDFAGADMDMGYNRTELKPVGDGRYMAEVTLPVCVTGQMKWWATVVVHTGRERLVIPYALLTGLEG